MIPEKEFALVEKKYGVDLGEKLKDGSPRYVFLPKARMVIIISMIWEMGARVQH